ncbi:MAG: hypothetical protein ACTHLB_19895 [Parafilimonas sp.]
MKKPPLFVGMILILTICISCKKLIQAVFPGKDIALETLKISVPPTPFADSSNEIALGSFDTYVNTDSIVRSETGGVFGINSIASIKVKEIIIKATNADELNNVSAFKSFRIAISSDVKPQPTNIVNIDIPSSATDSYRASISNSPDITGYLKGTNITYTIYGSLLQATTKTLKLSCNIVVRAD